MTIDQHMRLSFTGEFRSTVGPVEIWSWRLQFPQMPTTGDTDLTGLQAAVDDAAAAYTARIAPLHRSWVRLTRVRFSAHAPGGATRKQSNGAFSQVDKTVSINGTGTQGAWQPLQMATCVSLVTPAAGASGKGRVFLPQTHFSLGSDFCITSADAATIATAFSAFLKDIRDTCGEARVFSYKGTSAPVTATRVGVVPDTMRSRRNALLEAYASAPVPA